MEQTAAALKARGTRAWQAGDVPQATTLYADALAIAPSSDVELRAKLHGNLFLCKKKVGLWLLASQHAQHACELQPSWAKAHAKLAEAYLKLRRWEDAAGAAKDGLERDPDADVRRFLLARLAEAEREGSAKYVTCSPENDREIVDLLARFQRGEGDPDTQPTMIHRQPCIVPEEQAARMRIVMPRAVASHGWTNLNLLHIAAFHGDGPLVDALAAAGAAIDYPILPRDTQPITVINGQVPAISPAPDGLTPLVLSCAVLAFCNLSSNAETMGISLPTAGAAIRLVALGADLKQTLTLSPNIPTDMAALDLASFTPFLWMQMGLAGKTALQLALITCDASLIQECIARGAEITARDIEACPVPLRGRVQEIVRGCVVGRSGTLPPADLYDCRCGSRLLWSQCHGTDKLVHVDGSSEGRVLLRFSPCAPCPCQSHGLQYFRCCWDGVGAFFQDDTNGNCIQQLTVSPQDAQAGRLLQQMRLAEDMVFAARDADGRSLGRAMTNGEVLASYVDGVRSGLTFQIMAMQCGPKCNVAASWDREVYAGVLTEMSKAGVDLFIWTDTHWAIPKAELLSRVDDWNKALALYLNGRCLSDDARRDLRTRHSANPLAPCANPECNNVESQVKEFQKCIACKRVAYCSSSCQASHWLDGHRQQCVLSLDNAASSAMDPITAARVRAYAWRLLTEAEGDSKGDRVQRLLAAMPLMRMLPAEARSLPFFVQAAAVLTTQTRSDTVAAATEELRSVVTLWGAKTPRSIQRALEQLVLLRDERRQCKCCGRSLPRSAFSHSQWKKGQRRCSECQQGGVLSSLDERERQAAEEADRAAMAAIYAEGLATERRRIEEELARRNACERSDEECAVCFEQTTLAARFVMPCSNRHWLCKRCLNQSVEHARRSEPPLDSLACHMCRMPIALTDLPL